MLSPSLARSDREDPFSLTGFFPPSRLGGSEEEWSWIRKAQDEEEGMYYSNTNWEEPKTPKDDTYETDAATIRKEDKIGVLSINTLFASKDSQPTDARLFSPYSDDGAVDHESLYLALCSRRRDQRRPSDSESKPTAAFGSIFLPDSGVVEEQENLGYWANILPKF